MHSAPDKEFILLPKDPKETSIRSIAEAAHRLNEAILRAVDDGVSVQLVRSSRYHDGRGNWGDQTIPTIRKEPGDSATLLF